MFTKLWFKRVAERAVMTFFQVIAAMNTADALNWMASDWLGMLKMAGIAVLASVATSVVKSKLTGDPENPGLE
jgi:hypothetical protein